MRASGTSSGPTGRTEQLSTHPLTEWLYGVTPLGDSDILAKRGTPEGTLRGSSESCMSCSMVQIIRALRSLHRWSRRLWPSRPQLEIELCLWQEIIRELGRRGLHGRRESGAFLLAPREEDSHRVVRPAYFDDLDPNCLVGNIHIRSLGFSKLWQQCEEAGLRVLADVHTHPGASVAQSGTDLTNPMIAREGHLALIVPHYATRPVTAREVGGARVSGRPWLEILVWFLGAACPPNNAAQGAKKWTHSVPTCLIAP